MSFGAIFGLGPLEILIIVGVIVILFLPALLPKIAKRAAETFKVMKDMSGKIDEEDSEDDKED
jgi:Sec-independent protein translocase protein TatA